MRHAFLLTIAVMVVAHLLLAQESPTYSQKEHAINNGGVPAEGEVLTSATYRVTLGAIGDSVAALTLTGTSYEASVGFTPGYEPPVEILNVLFVDRTTMTWDEQPRFKKYNVYRGTLGDFYGGYGICEAPGLTTEQVTVDVDPSAGEGFFYLVTARSSIEESTMGFDSGQSERTTTDPCK